MKNAPPTTSKLLLPAPANFLPAKNPHRSFIKCYPDTLYGMSVLIITGLGLFLFLLAAGLAIILLGFSILFFDHFSEARAQRYHRQSSLRWKKPACYLYRQAPRAQPNHPRCHAGPSPLLEKAGHLSYTLPEPVYLQDMRDVDQNGPEVQRHERPPLTTVEV